MDNDRHWQSSQQRESVKDHECSGVTHCQRTCKISRWQGVTSEKRSQMSDHCGRAVSPNMLLHVAWLRSKARNITHRNGTKQSASDCRYFCTEYLLIHPVRSEPAARIWTRGHVPSSVLTFSRKRRPVRLMRPQHRSDWFSWNDSGKERRLLWRRFADSCLANPVLNGGRRGMPAGHCCGILRVWSSSIVLSLEKLTCSVVGTSNSHGV